MAPCLAKRKLPLSLHAAPVFAFDSFSCVIQMRPERPCYCPWSDQVVAEISMMSSFFFYLFATGFSHQRRTLKELVRYEAATGTPAAFSLTLLLRVVLFPPSGRSREWSLA